MNLNDALPRFALIISFLKEGDFPSLITITRMLTDSCHPVSTRTTKRDLEQLREVFGIDVRYDRTKDGYFLSKESEQSTDRLLDFLGVVRVNEVLSQSLHNPQEALSCISFEHEGLWAGARWLPELVHAVRAHLWIGFDYRKFDTDQVKHYSLQPLLLKQYQGRWYLIGQQLNGEDRTFGIDRIEELKIRDEAFDPPQGNPNERFRHVIGLNYSRGVVEAVRLSCDPIQAQYLKTLPLHKSQKIIRDGSVETVFEVRVIPNYEFIQRILMMGAHVKVLQPASLATEVYSHLAEAAKRYQ